MLAVDQEGVFPLPTDSGKGGQGFFQERGRIDANSEFSSPFLDGFLGKGFKFFPEYIMVVGTLGVGGDTSPGQGRAGLPAGQPGDQERTSAGVVGLGIGANVWVASHPVHGSLKRLGQPLIKVWCMGGGPHR